MTSVPERSRVSKIAARSAALSFTNPDDLHAWLDAVRHHLDDLGAAARDATARRSRRVLSRHEARRRANDAVHSLRSLLDAADRGLPREGDAP